MGGSGFDWATSIQQTTDGGYIVAGYSDSNDGDVTGNHGWLDYWVVKLDSTGNIQWQKSLGGSNNDFAYSIQQTTDGGYVVAGYSDSNDGDVSGNHGNSDYWIVKLGPDNLSTNEINSKDNFSIYPNPVKDILTIEGIAPNTQLIITDLTGKTILSTTVKSNKESIDVSGLPAGVYFINKTKFIKK
ncbi:MAG: T9SS type A sorting domain-containing protein [Weeksellaceae bacterium]